MPALVGAGLRVERDEALSFAMEHDGAAAFWDAAATESTGQPPEASGVT